MDVTWTTPVAAITLARLLARARMSTRQRYGQRGLRSGELRPVARRCAHLLPPGSGLTSRGRLGALAAGGQDPIGLARRMPSRAAREDRQPKMRLPGLFAASLGGGCSEHFPVRFMTPADF